MTELSFTKTYLSTLDSRPLKLQPDYAINPKELQITSTYTLPRMPNAMNKPPSSTSPSSTAITLTLKSTKNPTLELTLPDTDVSTITVLDLKERVAKELGLDGVGKVKVLYEKKPSSDAKTVKEVLGGEEGVKGVGAKGVVEFGVMVMGYKPHSAEGKRVGDGDKMDVDEAGKGLGELDESFWGDLKGFLQQRLKDEGRAEEVLGAFRGSWEGR